MSRLCRAASRCRKTVGGSETSQETVSQTSLRACPAAEKIHQGLVSFEAHDAHGLAKISLCTSGRGSQDRGVLRVSSCGETGPARQAEGHPASPVCCDQIIAHREAAKATSQVLWRFHSAELKIVHAEGKARGKSPVGGECPCQSMELNRFPILQSNQFLMISETVNGG